MNKTNLNNEKETKSAIFPSYIFKSDIRKILKYFNDFYNWHLSISILK